MTAPAASPGITQAGHQRGRRLSLLSKLAYSLGATVDGVTSNALNFFLLFYATAVCGLSGALAGVALSAGLAVDAILDPLIGSLSDGWRSRLGRRLPFMLVGLPLAAVSLVLIFSLPPGLGQGALFARLLALSVALRVSISLFNLPYYALGAELTDDYAERSRIVAWRWGIGMLGGLATVMLGFGGFLRGPGGNLIRAAYIPFALCSAALMVATASVSLVAAGALRDRTHVEEGRLTMAELLRGFGEVARSGTFRVMVLSTACIFIAQGVTFTLGLHASTYFWKLGNGQIQAVTLALFVGMLAGAPLLGAAAARTEKRTLLLASLVVLAATEVLPASLRLAGLLSIEGTRLTALLCANAVATGLGIAGAVICVTSMLADAADEHEYRFGGRREGLYFAGWTFAGKAAGGIGALVAGVALQASGFPTGSVGPGTPLALSPETIARLGLAYGPGAALFSVAGIVILLFYRLTRERHAAMLQELALRRAAEAALPRQCGVQSVAGLVTKAENA